MIRFNLTIATIIKTIQFYSPWRRYFFPHYIYNFTPPQLLFLCQQIEETRALSGAIAEVGCAGGKTTVFLKKYMDAQEIAKRYYAIDTFSGFTSEDVEFEVTQRNKSADLYRGFRLNSQRWFDCTLQLNGVSGVTSIKHDVNDRDLRSLAPLSFALLDVDLYRPTKKSLPELYEALVPGGVIVVDDCEPQQRWDGSYQAYREFVREYGLPERFVHGKLGVITKA